MHVAASIPFLPFCLGCILASKPSVSKLKILEQTERHVQKLQKTYLLICTFWYAIECFSIHAQITIPRSLLSRLQSWTISLSNKVTGIFKNIMTDNILFSYCENFLPEYHAWLFSIGLNYPWLVYFLLTYCMSIIMKQNIIVNDMRLKWKQACKQTYERTVLCIIVGRSEKTESSRTVLRFKLAKNLCHCLLV